MIDNMFIVSPPPRIKQAQDEQSEARKDSGTSILDFTDLDTDFLAEDFLAEDDLVYNELDFDLLDEDFLQDVLVAIEEVNVLKRRSSAGAGGKAEWTGTKLGFDKDTQYNSIIDQGMGQIWFYREVNGIISVRIPIGSNTTLRSENEGKENLITVGDGQSVIIIIRQGG